MNKIYEIDRQRRWMKTYDIYKIFTVSCSKVTVNRSFGGIHYIAEAGRRYSKGKTKTDKVGLDAKRDFITFYTRAAMFHLSA